MSPCAPTVLGFHCSHEQLPPSALLRHARMAAAAGFTAVMCSDHFHPWSERQGQSGYAWAWLGAALEAAPGASFGTVCAPGQRYHPAVIAQAAATLAEMYPKRFWLAVGTGEAVNEAITGGGWPSKGLRRDRLRESVDVMRALWAGDTVSTRGHVVTDGARLFTRPRVTPPLLGAALTPETARWVASWAEGLITVAAPPDRMRAVVDAFREGGGEGRPMYLQAAVSFAGTEAESAAAAHEQWRQAVLTPEQLANLRSPAELDAACDAATPDSLCRCVRVSAEIDRHEDWLRGDMALGFERIYVHNVARAHQERFIEACGARLLPALAQDHAMTRTGTASR